MLNRRNSYNLSNLETFCAKNESVTERKFSTFFILENVGKIKKTLKNVNKNKKTKKTFLHLWAALHATAMTALSARNSSVQTVERAVIL